MPRRKVPQLRHRSTTTPRRPGPWKTLRPWACTVQVLPTVVVASPASTVVPAPSRTMSSTETTTSLPTPRWRRSVTLLRARQHQLQQDSLETDHLINQGKRVQPKPSLEPTPSSAQITAHQRRLDRFKDDQARRQQPPPAPLNSHPQHARPSNTKRPWLSACALARSARGGGSLVKHTRGRLS
jgi:hypothetical protein